VGAQDTIALCKNKGYPPRHSSVTTGRAPRGVRRHSQCPSGTSCGCLGARQDTRGVCRRHRIGLRGTTHRSGPVAAKRAHLREGTACDDWDSWCLAPQIRGAPGRHRGGHAVGGHRRRGGRCGSRLRGRHGELA